MPAAPPGWRERVQSLSLFQIGVTLDTPYCTVFRWLQLIHSTGQDFGQKDGREWRFKPHELYVFNVINAFHKAGIPVGPAQIMAVMAFAYQGGRPVKPQGRLIQAGPGTEFAVDAEGLHWATHCAINDEVPHV